MGGRDVSHTLLSSLQCCWLGSQSPLVGNVKINREDQRICNKGEVENEKRPDVDFAHADVFESASFLAYIDFETMTNGFVVL